MDACKVRRGLMVKKISVFSLEELSIQAQSYATDTWCIIAILSAHTMIWFYWNTHINRSRAYWLGKNEASRDLRQNLQLLKRRVDLAPSTAPAAAFHQPRFRDLFFVLFFVCLVGFWVFFVLFFELFLLTLIWEFRLWIIPQNWETQLSDEK